MTRDLLDRLGAELGQDLRAAAGPPPALVLLRRHHRQRVAARAVLTVLAIVVAALALPTVLTGPGVTIDPVAPSPTSDPTPPMATPSTPIDLSAPVVTPIDLPGPVALRLLAVRFNNPSLALIDLEAGEVRLHAPRQHGLPTQDAVGGAQMLSGGSVVVWQNDTVTVLPPDLGTPTLVHRPEEMVYIPHAAPAFRVVPTIDEDALWVAQIGGGCCGADAAGWVELVDIATGQVMMATEVPADSFPVAANAQGLVMNTTAGWTDVPGRGWDDDPNRRETLLVRDDGSITSISHGWAITASSTVVAIQSCGDTPDGAGCGGDLELLDLTTGERTAIPQPVDGRWTAVNGPAVPGSHAPWSAVAPDGRLLLGIARSLAGRYAMEVDLVVLDPATLTATIVGRTDGKGSWPARWDQDGNHIVIADGRDLIMFDVEDGTSFVLENVVPDDHWVIAMR